MPLMDLVDLVEVGLGLEVGTSAPSAGITLASPVSAPSGAEPSGVPSATWFDGVPPWMAPLKLPVA
jgi:hypothetical protein